MTHEVGVRVQTVPVDKSGKREIRQRESGTTSLLEDRADEIEKAIQYASRILKSSVADDSDDKWRVSSLEASFSITLAAEAGVIVSKASTEATFEVTVTVEKS